MASKRTLGISSRFAPRCARYLRRGVEIIRDKGIIAFITKIAARSREVFAPRSYKQWIARYDTLDAVSRRQIAADIDELAPRPVISLFLPACDNWERLRVTLYSVQTQLYPEWRLLLGVSGSAFDELPSDLHAILKRDHRICLITVDGAAPWAAKANRLLEAASTEFVALLDPGDVLSEHALYWVAREASIHSRADLIFSDEDSVRHDGTRINPWFKPDWNPALMTSCNAFGRFGLYRRDLVRRLGGFRSGFIGAEKYELVLRCARAITPDRIRHVPRVLYHRRAGNVTPGANIPPNGGEAGRRAVEEHLAAQGLAAIVRRQPDGHQVSYVLRVPPPPVSVIVATTARPDIAEPCFDSLLNRTTYRDFEVLVMVSASDVSKPERASLLRRFSANSRVRISVYPDQPFNYSWVNNWGASQASGAIFCFLNDDTEVISPDWLEQLVARVSLPSVVAAGPLLCYPDGTIQHAGVILGLGGIAGHACVHQPRGSRGYFGRACLEQDVSCVTAACMAVRADAFRSVGGFDETMPRAYNDVDFCLRLRAAGGRIVWTPAVELIHRESISTGRHDSHDNAAQFARDVAVMHQRWGALLQADPFYNPNLSLERAYALAFPPRINPTHRHFG